MNKLENFLKIADTKQKTMIILSFLLILGLVLNEIVPPLLLKKERLDADTRSLELKIAKNSIKKFNLKLKQIQKEILTKREVLEKKQEDINYIASKVYEIKYVLFDDLKWTEFLNDILKYSLERNIKNLVIKNKSVNKATELFLKHKKNVQVSGVGRYRDILLFLQYIENLDVLVAINKIDLEQSNDKKVLFDLELNVYGVEL